MLLALLVSTSHAAVLAVKGFALTVSDVERSVSFYEKALGFTKLAERLIVDRDYDYLTGVFGMRVRSVTLKLGDEVIELNQFVTPNGKPIPVDSRSNDLWFQHLAIVVSDMDQAYARLRQVPHQAISSTPQTIPASNEAAAGIRRSSSGTPTGTRWSCSTSRRTRATPSGTGTTDSSFSASTTRRSRSQTRNAASPSTATCSA
jgi:catechol 2,3-dioxygenase-like lactoylglutathione lyase family enzyme